MDCNDNSIYWVAVEQPYRYRSFELLMDLWKHSLDLPQDMLPRIKSFLQERGYWDQSDDSLCVPRRFSSYIIEVAT